MGDRADRVVAVVLAGGRGTRMGADRNKVLLELAGRPLIDWSLAAFAAHPRIARTVLVGHPDDLALLQSVAAAHDCDLVAGGASRPESERRALDHLRADIERDEIDAVLIHDGARPLVERALIDRVIDRAVHRGVLPVLPAPVLVRRDTMQSPDGRLARAQTPQGGPARALLAAYDAAAGFEGTDTVSYLERAGLPVVAVPGDERNLKVTYPPDLARAAAHLAGS